MKQLHVLCDKKASVDIHPDLYNLKIGVWAMVGMHFPSKHLPCQLSNIIRCVELGSLEHSLICCRVAFGFYAHFFPHTAYSTCL